MKGPSTVWLSGGTGLVGSRLRDVLRADGAQVRVVTRSPEGRRPAEGVTLHGWDGVHPPAESLRGADAVVHLAGEPIFPGIPTPSRRERIWTSRIDSTRALVETLEALPEGERPRILVCASAVGYYGDGGDEWLDESAPPGRGFLAELCRTWEAEAARAAGAGLRVVSPRIGVVLAREGGALGALLPLFRAGLGGPVGSGRQWFSWIAADDVVALLRFAVVHEGLSGAVNAVAPEPVRNAEFARTLGRVLRRPAWLRVPAFALRLPLRDLARELTDSRRVRPARALEAGFAFRHPDLASALEAELRRKD